MLGHIPDHLKTQEMCEGAVGASPWQLYAVPDHFETQLMCIKALKKVDPWLLKYVPDHLKTQEMCDNAVRYYLYSLEHVPDWFAKHQKIKKWYDYVYSDEGLIR